MYIVYGLHNELRLPVTYPRTNHHILLLRIYRVCKTETWYVFVVHAAAIGAAVAMSQCNTVATATAQLANRRHFCWHCETRSCCCSCWGIFVVAAAVGHSACQIFVQRKHWQRTAAARVLSAANLHRPL